MIFPDNINSLESLEAWPALRLKKLKGDRKARFSIRINEQYRICFAVEFHKHNLHGIFGARVESLFYRLHPAFSAFAHSFSHKTVLPVKTHTIQS